uniref:Secreted protein n=1 Tax=Rhipicephalus appendiculatus TaxID=34631 RepID=A0A131YCT4_RHIAP
MALFFPRVFSFLLPQCWCFNSHSGTKASLAFLSVFALRLRSRLVHYLLTQNGARNVARILRSRRPVACSTSAGLSTEAFVAVHLQGH